MIEIFFTILIIAIISFLPIVLWGYIFSYIDESLASRRRFLLWVLAWAVSVVPVLYFDTVLWWVSLEDFNAFYFAYNYGSIGSFFGLNISLIAVLWVILMISFISSKLTSGEEKTLQTFLRNFCIFVGACIGVSVLFFFLQAFFWVYPSSNISLEGAVFWEMVFNSMKLVIFYYFLIAVLEETSKHFHFLGTGVLSSKNIKVAVLYGIFVALWFSFIENILYLFALFQQNGWSLELSKVYFFRSTFALFVHVLCSSVLSYYFAKALTKDTSFFSRDYIQLFLYGIAASIWLHAVFDISLTIWFGLVTFLYFVGGYLYVTSIFYREK